jgi:hypothetical protein
MQDRQKFASLLRNASQAVLANEAMASDLETMATALEGMPDEKFASFINAPALQKMFDDAKIVLEGTTPAPVTNPNVEVIENKSKWDKSASFKWNASAASLVKQKIASAFGTKSANLDASRPDAVKAAELPKEQIPDGTHNQGTLKSAPEATPAALTKEQTPDQAATLNSNMLAESEGAVKEASLYSFGGVDMPVADAIDGGATACDEELNGLFGKK